MKVAIMVNADKPFARRTARALLDVLISRKIMPLLHTETAALLGISQGFSATHLAAEADIIAVLGGDGTMLSSQEKLGAMDKPVAGINIGTLGFLTSCTDSELEFFADSLLANDYHVSRRILLHAEILIPDQPPQRFTALNEVVLARGQTGKLVILHTTINGEPVNRYRSDGLIVATPTGSTAYSLSAGGPLISPEARVLVITPICPHSLSDRSLVVDDGDEIGIEPDSRMDEPLFFTIDGRDIIRVPAGARISVRRAPHAFHLVRLRNRSFYLALRQKLGWISA
jgi:NAD+ kinase